MTRELKPCPFCGGDGVILARTKQVFDNSIGYIPLCTDCGCTVGSNIDTEFTAYTDFKTEQEAIEAWNRRVEPGDDKSLTDEEREILNDMPALKRLAMIAGFEVER